MHDGVQAERMHISMCLYNAVLATPMSKENYYLRLVDQHMRICGASPAIEPSVEKSIRKALPGRHLGRPTFQGNSLVCICASGWR